MKPKRSKKKIKEVDKKIRVLQKSTKTLFPQFVKIHNILRDKNSFYYKWHKKNNVDRIHIKIWSLYIVFILVFMATVLWPTRVTPIETQTISISNPHKGYSYNYKGNVHSHSINSDGTESPTTVGEWYRDNGYDFYTITDHNMLTSDPGVSDILWLGKSEEGSLSGNTAHMGNLNINTVIPNGDAQTMISNASSQGGQTTLHHIDRADKRWTAETIESLTGVMSLEIYNGGGLNSTGTWDTVLTSGKTIWGNAADDSHSLSAMGSAYIVVNSNSVSSTKEEILDQMASGNFYASKGFDLQVSVTDETISVSTTNGSKIRWIKDSGEVIKTTNSYTDNYVVNGTEKYVRIEILDAFGEPKAWSQPLVIYNESVSEQIKVDHFGYRTTDKKIAIITSDPSGEVVIKNLERNTVYTVSQDKITYKGVDNVYSGDEIWEIDFSDFSQEGTYFLESLGIGCSYNFKISNSVYNNAIKAVAKSLYYQRCGTNKPSQYAGTWSDDGICHTGDATATKAPSASEDFGTLDLSGGWHDAGDYNKYLWGDAPWDAANPWGLMTAYELNSGVFGDDTGIPESSNGVPDILDEVKWELDWYLKMQRDDGRVLDMVSAAVGDYQVGSPPSTDTTTRYYFDPKPGSAAHFVAGTAQGARVFQSIDAEYANTLKQAAIDSWNYLLTQGDSESKVWAAAEVFRMDNTIDSAKNYIDSQYASYDISVHSTYLFALWAYTNTPGATSGVVVNMKSSLSSEVDSIFSNNDYYLSGMSVSDYGWGSNRQKARYGAVLKMAADLDATGAHTQEECLEHAQDFLHYIHGLNSLNMLYMSNMYLYGGEHSVVQMYHAWFSYGTDWGNNDLYYGRPESVVDSLFPYFISDNRTSTYGPPPGILVGGPNKNYDGSETPPAGQVYPHRFYRDWGVHAVAEKSFQVNESSNAYTSAYIALASSFVNSDVSGATLPSVSFIDPSHNDTVQEIVNISVSASDDEGVFKVEFYVDNNLEHYQVVSGQDGNYGFGWLSTAISNGSYVIEAKVYDSSGNTNESQITVNVNNVVPGGYVLDGWGGVHPFGNASPNPGSSTYWRFWDIARDIAIRSDGQSGYVLDGFGGIHAFGGAPAISNPSPYWGWDIARRIELASDTSGYVLDGWGHVHPFGGASLNPGPSSPYWKHWDIARDFVLRSDGKSGYVLDGFGGIHPFGGAPAISSPSPYWGWDIARRIELVDDNSGYVLDGWGGIHPFGGASLNAGSSSSYWKHWDIARDFVLRSEGKSGYVLDGFGGIHSFGGAPTISDKSPYWGWDIARMIRLAE